MLDRLKAWNDRTRARNQARADRMNGWMDTHGPNAWGPAAAAARLAEPGALATLAGISICPDRIVRNDGVHPRDEQPIAGVVARVDTDGAISARGTLTRAITVGGGWQKEVDTRAAQLVIDGPAFQWVVPLLPDQAGQAREFAAQVTTAGRRSQV